MRKWPSQVSTLVRNVGRELSLLKMAIDMANPDHRSITPRFVTPTVLSFIDNIIHTRWSSRRYELGCDAPVIQTTCIFSMGRTGAPLSTAGSGVPGVTGPNELMHTDRYTSWYILPRTSQIYFYTKSLLSNIFHSHPKRLVENSGWYHFCG